MPGFRVRVLRDRTEYADLYIEADDADQAEEEAQIRALRNHSIDWELSTDAGSPRVADDETVEVSDEPIAEPDGLEYVRTRDFLLDLAERHSNGEADSIDREITDFFDGNGSLVCLTIAARYHGENPAVARILNEIKTALLGGKD